MDMIDLTLFYFTRLNITGGKHKLTEIHSVMLTIRSSLNTTSVFLTAVICTDD